MNALLARQLKKFLKNASPQIKDDENFQLFLQSISKSYDSYEDQFSMLQRAMEISSDELSEANEQLRDEAKRQKHLIDKLQSVIDTLEPFSIKSIENEELNLDVTRLTEFIQHQTEELLKVNEEQRQLLIELELQNKELNDYAHVVSHDLKSPLRNIDALASWLKEDHADKLGEDGLENLTAIQENVERMDNLISGILSYSSIAKENSIKNQADLNAIVQEVIEMINIPKSILVTVSTLPTLQIDRYKIQQVFQNLIDNASKSIVANSGKIDIDCKDKNSEWLFSVSDTGKGIEKEYHEKIFHVFQKLEDESNSTGIGLSIVKKVITQFGGQIWLESEKNKGTQFYFTIPK